VEEEIDKAELEDRYENRLKLSRRVQEDDIDVEQEEARLRDLYGKQTRFKSFDAETAGSARIPQQFLLPTPRDPKLWLVKCRPGREKDCVQSIMKKYLMRHNMGNPLQIYSVVARDSLKGYLYVEAFKLPHVQDAIEKIPNLFASKVSLVPIKEMVDVLKVKERIVSVKPGGWARVKRGKYAGDLAQVSSCF
jgi:transcription elongation factor SPT5